MTQHLQGLSWKVRNSKSTVFVLHAKIERPSISMDETSQSVLKMSNKSLAGDVAAICLSNICIIHCLALPILTVTIPSSFSILLDDEAFHLYMLMLVLPVSVWALSSGWRKHKKRKATLFGAWGLGILVLVTFFGHELFGEIGEKFVTIIGASIIAWAHYLNFNACKKLRL